MPNHQTTELVPWVWTKVGFLSGELLPTEPSLAAEANSMVQKAWIDLMWAVRLEQVLEVLQNRYPLMNFWDRYAMASNEDAIFYRSAKLLYEKVLEREKALLIRKLLNEELQPIGQEIWDTCPAVRDPAKLRELAESEFSPWHFPSLQILAGISAADMLSNMKFEANDVLDFRHAALAIPYCDAIFCDNPMATRLRNKPCRFGQIYGREILGRPEEILGYLKRLI